jgi:hypothetical protein
VSIDASELNELTGKAAALVSETADVPLLLRNHLGEQHQLVQAAARMHRSIEDFLGELRRFDVSTQAAAPEIRGGS